VSRDGRTKGSWRFWPIERCQALGHVEKLHRSSGHGLGGRFSGHAPT
jgi:hypothetical protein